jgi:hypothetical protein
MLAIEVVGVIAAVVCVFSIAALKEVSPNDSRLTRKILLITFISIIAILFISRLILVTLGKEKFDDFMP